MYAQSEIKLKGKGGVVGRVSGIVGGRERKGAALFLSRWLLE